MSIHITVESCAAFLPVSVAAHVLYDKATQIYLDLRDEHPEAEARKLSFVDAAADAAHAATDELRRRLDAAAAIALPPYADIARALHVAGTALEHLGCDDPTAIRFARAVVAGAVPLEGDESAA